MVHTNVTVNYWVLPANFNVFFRNYGKCNSKRYHFYHTFLSRKRGRGVFKKAVFARKISFFYKGFWCSTLSIDFLLAYLIDILIFNMICICSQLSNMLWVCKHVWIYRIGHEVNQMGVVLKDTFYFLCAFCCNSTIAIFDFTEINLQVWCWMKLLLS